MRTFFIFISLIVCQQCCAQWFSNGSTFTTQNGLSNNTVTCLQKDSAGFLWIGTHEGLNRYDGTEFINVLSNQKNNLPSNNITKIVFVSKARMFVGTDAGLCLLNTATLKGSKIDLPFNAKYPATGYYISDILYLKAKNEVWVCTWHGLFMLNADGQIQKKLMSPEAAISLGYFARHLFRDAENDVYFFSQQKKRFYYPDFTKNDLIPAENRQHDTVLNGFMRNGYALMSTQMLDHETLITFSKSVPGGHDEYLFYTNFLNGRHFLEKLSLQHIPEKRVSDVFPLNDSVFLVNSFFGEPMLYNTNSHVINMASDHPLWFTSWPDGMGAKLFADKNNTWVGTSKGLLQFPAKTNFFKTNSVIANALKDNKSLVSYNYGIYRDNKLWVACLGAGLFAADTLHNKMESFFDDRTALSFKRKIISTTVLNAGNAVWLFSLYGPVQANTTSKELSLVTGINKDPGFDESASYPLDDDNGNIWASLPDGITRYNISSNSFRNYKTKYKGGEFPLLRAGPKAVDKKGNMWMTRGDTLVKMNMATQQFSTFLLNKNSKPIRPVAAMASDGNDTLYLAVAGSLGIYTISTGNINFFTKQTGIISTAINDIVSDNAGNAWIATEGGLVFFNKLKRKFSSFTKADGLPDDNVMSANFADKEKKTLFLGFSKTFCLFQPKNFLLEKELPQNIITGMEAAGEGLALEQQTLSYKQNNIIFTYTGINYNQGQQNNYACMLEGFDQEWKYTGAERKINYINLPTGKYVFKIKTANHQGEWNEQPATLSFEITPPFWLQWWFLLLLSLLVIFGIYYLIKKRELSLQKENNTKLQMSELRMQALRAQMNPHFIFNSLNSIQNYILTNNTIDAAGYLSKFAKLMRRILDQSKHNFLPLGEVMETLQLYVEIESFRFNHEFSYSFEIEQTDELLDADLPPMLLQPFVENAILHGLMPKKGEKKLIIRCCLVNNNVEIIIDDNGIGRHANTPKTGHESQGEKLTAGMLESLQQLKNNKAVISITDKTENELPAGTIVKLVLPLN